MVDFTLNGEARTLAKGSQLRDLIVELGLIGEALSVKVNKRQVPRHLWRQELQQQDRLEIGFSLPGVCSTN